MDNIESPIVLGVSLKLYLDVADTMHWAQSVSKLTRTHPAIAQGRVRLFVLPSLPALPAVKDAFRGTPVSIGAQDLFWKDRGAFTGAVSGTDLRAVGCSYVEVGHAERRTIFGDDDETVGRKLAAALRNHLTPVLCVGETEKSDSAQAALETVHELESALTDVVPSDGGHDLIVAYEPRWTIGQTQPASPEHIGRVITELRQRLASDHRIRASSVLYGGSAQPGTLSMLGRKADGLFLGRFAHDPKQFALILDEAAALNNSQLRMG
ncbi:triosephosphate isomerase [Arthrobacter sp. SDTb3-6]|nr:triosephosphate isomerase [Arthrobacter sp. SDTb3-6]